MIRRPRLFVPLVLVCVMPYLLLAALSDPAALKLARQTWGEQAMIGTVRNTTQSNWTRLVGFKSDGCQQPFTTVGSGFNTWDAAFANATMNPYTVHGPYRGTLTLKIQTWDNVAVFGVQFFIDSVAQVQIIPDSFGPNFTAQQDVNTVSLTNGIHVWCIRAWDVDNSVGRSSAFLFRVDQSTGITGATLYPNEKLNGPPGVSKIPEFAQR